MKRVWITGIGGSIGIDVARSLRADPSLHLIGSDGDPRVLKQVGHLVDEVKLLPRADKQPVEFRKALAEALKNCEANFVFPNPDAELEALAECEELPCPSSMPPFKTSGILLDKSKTAKVSALTSEFPKTFEVGRDGTLEEGFKELKAPLWMRATIGASGRGSLEVSEVEEARAWIAYWDKRGREDKWMLQEFLPGKNINWTGLYCKGRLVVQAAMERLAYFLGGSAPSGVSGQVSRCVTIDPKPFEESCERVIGSLDATPHGVYSVDLRYDRDGKPRITEINPRLAGRPWLYTNAGLNLPLATVRALSEPAQSVEASTEDLQIGVHLFRQLDIEPLILHPEETSECP